MTKSQDLEKVLLHIYRYMISYPDILNNSLFDLMKLELVLPLGLT
jgi:hypothetical protein